MDVPGELELAVFSCLLIAYCHRVSSTINPQDTLLAERARSHRTPRLGYNELVPWSVRVVHHTVSDPPAFRPT